MEAMAFSHRKFVYDCLASRHLPISDYAAASSRSSMLKHIQTWKRAVDGEMK
jgi:hypothetical protein